MFLIKNPVASHRVSNIKVTISARPPDQVRGHAYSGNPSHPLSLPDPLIKSEGMLVRAIQKKKNRILGSSIA